MGSGTQHTSCLCVQGQCNCLHGVWHNCIIKVNTFQSRSPSSFSNRQLLNGIPVDIAGCTVISANGIISLVLSLFRSPNFLVPWSSYLICESLWIKPSAKWLNMNVLYALPHPTWCCGISVQTIGLHRYPLRGAALGHAVCLHATVQLIASTGLQNTQHCCWPSFVTHPRLLHNSAADQASWHIHASHEQPG